MRVCLEKLIFHILKSVLPNILQYVLPNKFLKKCPSEHDAMCPSEHELKVIQNWTMLISITLELKHNCCSHLRTSSETYPYPKGEHNGAVGPKYATWKNIGKNFSDETGIPSEKAAEFNLWFYYFPKLFLLLPTGLIKSGKLIMVQMVRPTNKGARISNVHNLSEIIIWNMTI